MVINVKVDSNKSREDFKKAVCQKHIPVLTLDKKWHELFAINKKTPEVEELENKVNELLKRQGFLNTEIKKLKIVKSNLMNEIVEHMDETEQSKGKPSAKMTKNQELIKEANEKLEEYQDELLDIPSLIKEANNELMIATMDICYHRLYKNSSLIIEISEWIRKVRDQLKQRIMKKKAMEIENQLSYTYMHNIFGHELIDIFDLKYVEEEANSETLPSDRTSQNVTNKTSE